MGKAVTTPAKKPDSDNPDAANHADAKNYVDERVFLESEQTKPRRVSGITLTSWLFRLIRPDHL